MQQHDTAAIVELLKKDRRFMLESYRFVTESLEYAQQKMFAEAESETLSALDKMLMKQGPPHISGQDLCRAVCEIALSQYGLMAKQVLLNLGIRKTNDIGVIVYNLIEIGFMFKTDDDSLEDFDNVLDLTRELDEGFTFCN